jgi:hypothetical protein
MSLKANADHRHKFPKARYRMPNCPEYDAALVQRGSLTVWLTDEAIAGWRAPTTGKRGDQPVYSDLAIETGLALPVVLRCGLRQSKGTSESIAQLSDVDMSWRWPNVVPERMRDADKACLLDRRLLPLSWIWM